MEKKDVSRKELLERWSVIEQEDDDDGFSSTQPIKRRRLRQLKEQWFADAFYFLIYLSKENHVWCGYWDLMGPLVETFYNYFKDESNNSPLKLLWSRISEEMRSCTLCIHQHHQAQEMYETEYEQSCISPLLDVLHMLDEERITLHLKDLNARIARGEYDMSRDYGEVVGVMFEVLTYPILLDDQYLNIEFHNFIEVVDDSHELAFDGHQHYPGVYALLFSKSRRVRSIGLRLAGHMGRLRRSTDLDPLQHLLKKCIHILEAEVPQTDIETPRPKVQLDRITVWLGMKALVGFLEPSAFEEGILDQYPIFLSIVLNHISDDSVEFSHAVNCLRLLFEKLGDKLWLRATLSPSVVRNTLLGQCFHTRNEKSHKEIFDLFQPFLQSLEALQDGEHEKQRRHFLYFLLHQVPVSSNFSILMRKMACQIALMIILQGYRMDPPSPPYECAHMWGPSLVSSLKDSSLHSSLRQPAIDLIQIIIVSDASALMSVILNGHLHSIDKPIQPNNYGVPDDEEILSGFHIDEKGKDNSCWEEYTLQHKIVSQVNGSWMCIPMLWFDVLVELDPLVLPLSFSKAVIWALSQFSLIEIESSTEISLSVRNWLTTNASEICYLLGWKVPTGSDDGGDGTELKNSIRISTMCRPLVRTFKRLTTYYTVKMEQRELRKQWIWEPVMSNSLILLLVDPNDSTRQVGRLILEQVSHTRGLTCGLQFLCSTPSSLLATLMGLKHAMELVQLDSVLLNFQTLHHLFFILCKLLKEGNSSTQTTAGIANISKFSSHGGFLKQPVFDSSATDGGQHSSMVSSSLWKKFSCLLSQVAWPSILKCLGGGKTFTEYTVSQMTCIRLLEVIPIVFERLPQNSGIVLETLRKKKWLHDLADWGKSPLAVVVRYWKQTLSYLLGQIRATCSKKSASTIIHIEKLISQEIFSMDEVSNQIARLYISLADEGSFLNKTTIQSTCSPFGEFFARSNRSADSEIFLVDEAKENISNSKPLVDLEEDHVIILSDDEEESNVPADDGLSNSVAEDIMHNDNSATMNLAGEELKTDLKDKDFNADGGLMCLNPANLVQKLNVDNGGIQRSKSPVQTQPPVCNIKEDKIRDKTNHFLTKNNSRLMKISDESINSDQVEPSASQLSSSRKGFDITKTSASKGGQSVNRTSDDVVKEIVCDAEDDTWQFSFFKPPKGPKHLQTLSAKPIISGPKRQVIQLSLPSECRPGSVRLGGGAKRFQAPSLVDWYRPILELDFFAAVGLASETDKYHQSVVKLKEVPVCFQSPDGYVEIFRPLVLEEFKAQLQSSYQEMASCEEICTKSLSVLSVERIDDFHVVRFVQDENESAGSKSLLENDLILLTRQPLQNSINDVHTVGKVERREKDNKKGLNVFAVRLYLQGGSRLDRARKLLTVRSKWYVSRIMSITPQLREFQALSSIREIPLLPIILNPTNYSSGQNESETENCNKLSKPLQQIFKSSFNGSQLQAIGVAVGRLDLKKDFKLTLIQGPPGTGKTRTILAIVSGLLAFSEMKDSKGLRKDGSVYSNSSSTSRKMNQSAAIARAWQDAALARQLNDDVEYNKKYMGSSKGRILICAQSNAAVDELVSRISSEGLYGSDGERYKPYLVRVGNAKTVHPNSLPFFIDTLVESRLGEKKMNELDGKNGDTDSLTMIRANLEKLVDQIRYYEAKRASLLEENSESNNLVEGDCGDGKALSEAKLKGKLRQLYEQKKSMYADLAKVQATERKTSEELRCLRHKFRKDILKEAEIVVTTLSGCGGDLYGVCSESTSNHKFMIASENTLFDAVVIDEAAQALEPATLIPLQLLKSRGTRCIMVGDPKQLPATVLSNVASKYLFQCSMFERLQRAGHPVVMLTEQYRMHPEICHFPSLHFYDGKLLNGDQMSSKAASFHKTLCLGPYVFFDIIDGQELRGKNSVSSSLCNEYEADAAVEVLQFFKKRYPSEFLGGRIGVITPYKRQLSLLRSRFSNTFGSAITSEMEFNTVDGFQGREVDILLLSTVRASGSCTETARVSSSNIGFVADVRRMNVALTRAKFSLWIFGNSRTLRTNQSWGALIDDAKQRNLVVPGRKPYSSLYKYSLESSAVNSSNIQLEEIESARECVNTQKKVKHISETKRKCNDTELSSVYTGEASRSAKNANIDVRRKTRDGTNTSVVKEAATVAIPKGAAGKESRAAVSGLEGNTEKSYKSSAYGDRVVKTHDAKGSNSDNIKKHSISSDKVKSRSQKLPSAVDDETHMKTIKHDKPVEVKIGSSSERRCKGKGESKASSDVEVHDAILKRKQQREAVNALLSSALISTKKSESSKKSSTKRSLPTTSTSGHHIRPPKRRNDT